MIKSEKDICAFGKAFYKTGQRLAKIFAMPPNLKKKCGRPADVCGCFDCPEFKEMSNDK